jgi:serine/threonine-protein kinase
MNRNKWQQVKKIFDAALKLAPNQRELFLDKSCGNDDGLRREVEKLLASFADDSFMEKPAANEVASVIIKAETKHLEAGKRFGHYEIIRQIGAGGMGEVYLAKDTRLNRKVALKVLPEYLTNDKSRLQRFEQEARAASALNHPNILTVYEIGEVEGKNYIATELIEGKTLRDQLSEKEPFQLNSILKISVQVSEALAAAHQAGIIHRDIKPENIMIREDGYAKVLDFGLAKLTEKAKSDEISLEGETKTLVQTNPGIVMGTVSYMSPEQARGKETDARTDIWSLGVVLYEMLAGKVPFAGETINHTIVAILEKEPLLLENVPDELQRIVRKALSKDKQMRYQTVRDLLIDLKNLRRTLDIQGELERSVTPNKTETTATGNENATQVYAVGATATTQSEGDAARTKEAISVSSLEYAVIQAKSNKRAAAIVGIILLGIISAVAYFGFFARSSTKQIESIAVMPFINEGGNADTEYLSDGMTETLISSLSQLPNLNVKARSSVFRYKGKEVDLQKIAQELNVQAILNGRVAQRGEQLILNLELVDAQSENVIWSEQYARRQSDLVSLQSEIARDVASKLRTRLSGAQQNQIAKNYTANTEAYQLYLKGRFYLNKRSSEGIRKASDYFKRAIAIDPNYALAYSGLSDAYQLLPIYDNSITRRETMPLAKEAALKALLLNDDLAEAHASLAPVLSDHDKDWNAAEQHYRRAIALNPNYATAHQWYGETLFREGRFGEGEAEIRRALELDPFSLITNMVLGMCLNAARRYDEAIVQLQKTLELDPNFADANYFLFEAYANKKMYAEAVAAFTKQMTNDGEPAAEIAATKEAFARNGWEGFLRHRINYELSKLEHVSPGDIASFYARLGDKDKAFEWLEKAYEQQDEGLTLLKVEPRFDSLRDDPRFQDLVRRIGLPQ